MAADLTALTAFALFLAAALRSAAPLCIAAMGGVFSAQVNVFNVGLEGMMLLGAFCGFAASDATGSATIGLLAGAGGGLLLAFVLAFFIIDLKANEVVAGIAANLAMVGLTAVLLKTFYGASGAQQSTTAGLVPGWLNNPLADVPIIGAFLSGLDAVMLLAVLAVAGTRFFLYRTVHGLRMRAIGDDRSSAVAAGIDARRYVYLAFLVGGVLCGLAGAYYPLSGLSMFSTNMTAGAGFIALAAVLFGSGKPMPAAAGTLVFGLATAASFRLQTQWIPSELVLVLPYVATIGALAFSTWRERRHAGRARPALQEGASP
jgi:simple sugar transport system permease protein